MRVAERVSLQRLAWNGNMRREEDRAQRQMEQVQVRVVSLESLVQLRLQTVTSGFLGNVSYGGPLFFSFLV